MIKKNCRLCNSKKLYEFLDLGLQPPSDQFKFIQNLNKPTEYYPLKVNHCLKCGFKQLNYVVDPKILYQENYPYESSLTNEGKKHYKEFADSTVKKYDLVKGDLSIDIGSNTGTLVKAFKDNSLNAIGIDPASNICKIANKRNLKTFNSFFDNKITTKILGKYGKAMVITGTNVFAHVDNLDSFTKNIVRLLEPKKGIFVIEVPHFLHLIKKLEYDTIYHEHLSYITVEPLIKFFKKYNLEIIDVQQRDIHGGSIRIFISKKNNFSINRSVKKICKLEKNIRINSKKTLNDFAIKVKQNRYQIMSTITKLKKQKKKIVVLSAPAKGMTLLNYCKIDKDYIDYATEKSSIKQGLLTPGTNIRVFSDKKLLQTKPDYALLLAWNFSKEIIRNNHKFMKRGGKFIIPIPKVKIVGSKNAKN
ncbi:MAG: class I SAM-dependent methyltransferase [Pelagibacteraceae bacterium]